ncbi:MULTISPECIES: apolipoprotein N-acyltransferase [unclassified Desulfovibrio]|uniref:apolipoprotein N-acyltransferase n=1 Tax=unclassified Desulfovibrio TaxID=2593640 RepID=UPI001F1519F3|nr:MULTISPECIES: apolipoprotein N-acyltransferase [unclassified Desulfovibrio]
MKRPWALAGSLSRPASVTAGMRGPASPGTALWALAAVLGLWLGFPNDILSAPPLALLWPLALTALGLSAPGARAALRRGWLTSLAGGTATLYWLSLPVHDVGGLPWALAVPCAVFIAALVTLQGALFCAAARLGRGLPAWRLALALALAWYFLEYAFALVVGFPWLPLAGALAPWPLLVQAADTLGAYGTGALWLWAGLLALLAFPRLARVAAPDIQGFRPLRLACAGAVIALTLGYGHWQLEKTPFTPEPAGPDSVAVLFVEGNVDQGQKWLPAMQAETTELYRTLTEEGLTGLGWRPGEEGAEPPLVIWPETALPFFFQTHRLSAKVLELVRRERVPLLFGAPGVERPAPGKGAEPLIFNRAFLLAPDGSLAGFYDKEHLVPFGEYAPDWLNWPFLEALLQGVGVYTEGTATAPLRYGNLALGMLICYEGIFSWLAQARVADGANILADISNDGWFRGTPASRQHLYLTVLRALEQGRWLLRGTNTGISAVADTRGRLTAMGPLFRAGTLAARARLCSGESRYHRLAPWLPLMALGALLVVTVVRRRGRAWAGTTRPN